MFIILKNTYLEKGERKKQIEITKNLLTHQQKLLIKTL